MPRATLLKACRLTHLYFGVFITPALLFFAFTGALQTFGLHEANRDHPNYKPAHWIQVLAQIHKKQDDTVPVHRPQPGGPGTPAAPLASPAGSQAATPGPGQHKSHDDAQDTGARGEHPDHQPATTSDRSVSANTSTPTGAAPASMPATAPATRKPSPLPLRIFFLIVCIGLFTSTLTGLYMSYVFQRNNRIYVTLTLMAGVILPPLLLLF